MRSFLRGTIAAFVLVLGLALAAPAVAAPVVWESVDVSLHDEKPTPILLVSGTLPQSAKLPAQVELSVPKGAQFQWAGEILGGPANEDPAVQYTVESAADADVYTFTLTQARTGQVEVVMPTAVQFDGTQYATSLTWTATQDVGTVNLSSRMPQAAQISTAAEGAQTVPGPTGYAYYEKTVTGVKPGDVLDLSFAYTLPAGATPGQPAAPSGSNDSVVLVLVAVAFGAAFLFFGRAISHKMKTTGIDPVEAPDRPARSAASHAFDEEVEEPAQKTSAAEPKGKRRTSPAPAAAPASAEGRKALDPRWLLAGLVVAALVAAGLLAGKNSTSAQLVNGTYQRHFGGTSVCTSTEIALSIPADANQAKAADKIFSTLEGQAGVGQVTIFVDRPRAVIEFCQTSNSEQAIRAAVSASGYVDATAPVAPSTAPTATPQG